MPGGWGQQLFEYCERGLDGGWWAEPANAASNAAIVLAAVMAGVRLWRQGTSGAGHEGGRGPGEAERRWLGLLVALVAVIGLGSFLFHTVATRWAKLADVAPITLFMIAYLVTALRSFLACGWACTGASVVVFLGAGWIAGSATCGDGTACLNGSLGYLPALATLVIVGLAASPETARRGLLLGAAATFSVSLALRTLDLSLCASTSLLGHRLGTHAAWHILNGVTLYWLLVAAIDRPRRRIRN